MPTLGLKPQEIKILSKLNTPSKIQNFLDKIPYNFERRGGTCKSPRRVLREKNAHCFEGALLAASALRLQGRLPLIVDLQAAAPDSCHVLAVFKNLGHWGAISKTNHAVLRYREPVYRTIRELVMSYFHEYFLDNGRKTLRSYAGPINLTRFDDLNWMTAEEDLWSLDEALDQIPHKKVVLQDHIKNLRKADPIEIKVGKLKVWRA